MMRVALASNCGSVLRFQDRVRWNEAWASARMERMVSIEMLGTTRRRTRRYASQRGWVIGAEYAEVLTGTRADRPQYRALLEDARKLRAHGRPVAVVVQWLDRFGRSVFERARSADELRSLGVPIHSVMEGGEIPELVANLLAAVAQEEVRRFAERTAEVRRHVIASGWYFPCRAPWGYMWRASTHNERALGAPGKVLVVDAGRAPHAQEAWRRIAAGSRKPQRDPLLHVMLARVHGLPHAPTSPNSEATYTTAGTPIRAAPTRLSVGRSNRPRSRRPPRKRAAARAATSASTTPQAAA